MPEYVEVSCLFDSPILSALFRDYFEDEHLDKKGSELDLSGWTLECCDDVPQQNNGSDCGVFACCFAELLSRRRELRCTQHAISKYRRQMVYEILNKRLL